MKLVDILARELKVWPEGVDSVWQSSFDNEIYFDADVRPFYTSLNAEDSGDRGAVITQAEWQAAVDSLNAPKVVESESAGNPLFDRSNDNLAILVASKTFCRFGNIFWGSDIRRKDLVGKVAGTISTSDGYRYVKCGKSRNRVAVHRVVFLMHHGYIPEVIDHINGVRDDNRAENLRDAMGQSNNCANQKKQDGRTSRYKGVCWDSSRGKWSAYAKQNGRSFSLGRFASEDQAAMAYNKKAKELFGEFANLNIIRTAEQVAAEERDKLIYQIRIDGDLNRTDAERLYDAGYRKEPKPCGS